MSYSINLQKAIDYIEEKIWIHMLNWIRYRKGAVQVKYLPYFGNFMENRTVADGNSLVIINFNAVFFLNFGCFYPGGQSSFHSAKSKYTHN